MVSTYKSILVWPKEVSLGWHESAENKSEDSHGTATGAKAVCRTLIWEGFGCDREIFPIEARVECNGKVLFQWKKGEGFLIDEITDDSRFPKLRFG